MQNALFLQNKRFIGLYEINIQLHKFYGYKTHLLKQNKKICLSLFVICVQSIKMGQKILIPKIKNQYFFDVFVCKHIQYNEYSTI